MSIRFSDKDIYIKNSRALRSWFWVALGALAIWIGFPSLVPSLPPLVLLWPVALWRLGVNSQAYFSAFRWGVLSSFAGSLAALYWLAMPVAQVGGLSWPAAIACAALIAMVLASQGGLFAMAARWLRHRRALGQAAALALIWYFLEFLYAVIAGFPWLPLSGALAQWPVLIQPASILGAWLLGALWLCGLFWLFLGRIVYGFVLLGALLIYGGWKIYTQPVEITPGEGNWVAALLVEGNVDQNQKWTFPFQEKSLLDYLRLTREGLRGAQRELNGEKPLVIWPETALPFFYERNPRLASALEESVAQMGCPLLFGAPGVNRGPQGDIIFNRAFLLNDRGEQTGHYDKEHLVPFGEYLPSWLKLDFLEALLQGVGIYEEGENAGPMELGRLALGALICYEGIFPWLAQDRVSSGANILVDISNDGWFGYSPASRQHLYLTVLRCVEQGRYMFRATNTGISALIDAQGRVVRHGGLFQAGSMLVWGKLLDGKTIYHRWAVWQPWICGALLILLCITGGRKYASIK